MFPFNLYSLISTKQMGSDFASFRFVYPVLSQENFQSLERMLKLLTLLELLLSPLFTAVERCRHFSPFFLAFIKSPKGRIKEKKKTFLSLPFFFLLCKFVNKYFNKSFDSAFCFTCLDFFFLIVLVTLESFLCLSAIWI